LQEKKETQGTNIPLRRIYFYLTEGCNLACRHCWINPKFQTGEVTYPSLPIEIFQSVVKQAKPLGLLGVKLTGGEPLMHPQIHEILDFVKFQEINLEIESNGILCTPELAEKIATSKNPCISISLDGIDAQTHEWVRGVAGSFESALTGIKHIVKAGIRPKIIMSLMRRNKDQMKDVVRMAEELGAASVKFNIVLPSGRGKKIDKG
ncbi:MAG: radical SAM protein, partial [bacterium]|nr:radical SAM protein [bacterium]